jgi:hypothetical protein
MILLMMKHQVSIRLVLAETAGKDIVPPKLEPIIRLEFGPRDTLVIHRLGLAHARQSARCSTAIPHIDQW